MQTEDSIVESMILPSALAERELTTEEVAYRPLGWIHRIGWIRYQQEQASGNATVAMDAWVTM